MGRTSLRRSWTTFETLFGRPLLNLLLGAVERRWTLF